MGIQQVHRIMLIIAALVLPGWYACAPSPRPADGQRAPDMGRPALHAVHSDDLKQAMRELDRHSADRLAIARFTGTEAPTDLQAIAAAASAMATTAGHIPEAAAGARLAEHERREFVGLAVRLGDESRELHQAAVAGDAPRTRRSVDRVMATCTACHARFRVSPESAG